MNKIITFTLLTWKEFRLNQNCVALDADKPGVSETTSEELESDDPMPEELDAEEADLGTSHLDSRERK